MMKHLLVWILIVVGMGIQSLLIEKTKPLPLQKKQIVLSSPRHYLKRVLRVDPKTGKEVLYDPQPRIELIDAKTGKYALKWMGYDGKEKVVVYQRPDEINVIVSVSVEKNSSGRYVYEYTIQNLATSGEYLAGFAVQTFSSDMTPNEFPAEIDNIFISEMSNTIPEFKDGRWIRFAPLSERPQVNPGQRIIFKLTSSSPPGLLMCRIHGGDFVMKGVGEHMPQELEDTLPGYEAWPSGLTIGPVENLKTLSKDECARYLLDRLPKFKELGWMTSDVVTWYEQHLKSDEWEALLKRAEQDLKAEKITTEVFAMITGLAR
ncbi:MAG: hypothetical protein AB1757_30735 [Acidobacteriota bacterium]